MWRAANTGNSIDVAEEGRRAYQVAGMVALATGLVTLAGLAVLAIVAALAAVLRGQAGIAAAIVVLIAVALLRRKGQL
jgi:hypothetical protein